MWPGVKVLLDRCFINIGIVYDVAKFTSILFSNIYWFSSNIPVWYTPTCVHSELPDVTVFLYRCFINTGILFDVAKLTNILFSKIYWISSNIPVWYTLTSVHSELPGVKVFLRFTDCPVIHLYDIHLLVSIQSCQV